MRNVLITSLLFWILAPVPSLACGKERWPVKTLKDSLGEEVAKHSPTLEKIAELVTIGAPTRKQLLAATSRRFAIEHQVFRVSALVLGDKQETDEDFHVVLADPADPHVTIIGEIPAGDCVASSRAQFFNDLRAEFSKNFGKPTQGKLRKLAQPVAVCVTGVSFFDFLHGQDGVAPNGFELHPVLSIEKGKCT